LLPPVQKLVATAIPGNAGNANESPAGGQWPLTVRTGISANRYCLSLPGIDSAILNESPAGGQWPLTVRTGISTNRYCLSLPGIDSAILNESPAGHSYK